MRARGQHQTAATARSARLRGVEQPHLCFRPINPIKQHEQCRMARVPGFADWLALISLQPPADPLLAVFRISEFANSHVRMNKLMAIQSCQRVDGVGKRGIDCFDTFSETTNPGYLGAMGLPTWYLPICVSNTRRYLSLSIYGFARRPYHPGYLLRGFLVM